MVNMNYPNDRERTQAVERKIERSTWWPFYALLAVAGILLFWESWSPLPQIPTQVIGLAALGLLFGGIALWVIFTVKE